MTEDLALLRRFQRTVRVAVHTALAEWEIAERATRAAAPITFRALAARSTDGFRFPDAGIGGADGLLLASLERDGAGVPARLVLQAQGVAGLSVYAGRAATVGFGPLAPEAVVRFDDDGRAVVDVAALALDEDDLAAFDLSLVDPS